MSMLIWDQDKDRHFEYGVQKGVFYSDFSTAKVWNGLISVTQNHANLSVEPFSFDGIKYLDHVNLGNLQISLTAYQFPEEFLKCLGNASIVPGVYLTRQPIYPFHLSYQTQHDDGQQVHILYNVLAVPSSRSDATTSATSTPSPYTFNFVTTPLESETHRPTSHIMVDSRKTPKGMWELFERELYGYGTKSPYLPTPKQIGTFFNNPIIEPLKEPI